MTDSKPRRRAGLTEVGVDHDDPLERPLLRQYQRYFNESRPHQGLGQRVPARPAAAVDLTKLLRVTSVLSGFTLTTAELRDAS